LSDKYISTNLSEKLVLFKKNTIIVANKVCTKYQFKKLFEKLVLFKKNTFIVANKACTKYQFKKLRRVVAIEK